MSSHQPTSPTMGTCYSHKEAKISGGHTDARTCWILTLALCSGHSCRRETQQEQVTSNTANFSRGDLKLVQLILCHFLQETCPPHLFSTGVPRRRFLCGFTSCRLVQVGQKILTETWRESSDCYLNLYLLYSRAHSVC